MSKEQSQGGARPTRYTSIARATSNILSYPEAASAASLTPSKRNCRSRKMLRLTQLAALILVLAWAQPLLGHMDSEQSWTEPT